MALSYEESVRMRQQRDRTIIPELKRFFSENFEEKHGESIALGDLYGIYMRWGSMDETVLITNSEFRREYRPCFDSQWPNITEHVKNGRWHKRNLSVRQVVPLAAPAAVVPLAMPAAAPAMPLAIPLVPLAAVPPAKTVYILELEYGRVYVGCSKYVDQRIAQHMTGFGSAFTRMFKPTGRRLPRLGNVVGDGDAPERDETLRYMLQRGVRLVRGWRYTLPYLTDADRSDAEANIRELGDLCRRCGHAGHFVADCRMAEDRLGFRL